MDHPFGKSFGNCQEKLSSLRLLVDGEISPTGWLVTAGPRSRPVPRQAQPDLRRNVLVAL